MPDEPLETEVVTLPYARPRRRWSRRHSAYVATLVLALVGGYWGYREVARRVVTLERDSFVGPVDWPTVLVSWTRLKLAWRLSAGRPTIAAFAIRSRALPGISEAGTVPDDITLTLGFPLHYADGEVTVKLMVANTGERDVIVPPLKVSGGRSVRITGYHAFGHWLGRGNVIVPAHESRGIELRFPANETPHVKVIDINIDGPIHVLFALEPKDGKRRRWEDLSADDLEWYGL
jgi:hypothetical protein